MATYWTIKKQCATCAYWNGPRRMKSDPRVVECPNDYNSAMGMCQGTRFPAKRGKLTHASTCAGGGMCWSCAKGLVEHY